MLLTITSFFGKFFFLLVFSWFLIHILAVLGLFFAAAYPIWWFIAPKKIPCLFCQIGKEGQKCFACGSPIRKADGLVPKSFRSALINASLILVFFLTSLVLVFVESKFVFRMGFPFTPKTVDFVIPSKGQYRLEEIFPMKIELAGIQSPINAVRADFSFDSRRLELMEISTENSFANIFIHKEIDNKGGYARLTGGLPDPGFLAESGLFATVFFKGKAAGLAQVEFLPTSLVLANDGQGTNVLEKLAAASYLILPEELTEEEKEEQVVLLQPGVLGEETEETQLKFYQEEGVLGTQLEEEMGEREFDLIQISLGFLEKLDRFILSFWGRALSLF